MSKGQRLSVGRTDHWGGKRRRPMTDIFSRVGMTLGTFTSVGKYDTALATQMEQPEVHRKSQENSMLMWTGDIRYLMAVLALVNYPHTIVERDQTTIATVNGMGSTCTSQ